MGSTLLAGTAKVDITPSSPIPLAGYAGRIGHYEGIARSLHARIWVFGERVSQQDVARIILVQADLIWWGSERSQALITRIKQQWQVEQVMLHATHTHSGPQTSANFTSLLGQMDVDYVHELEDTVLQGIAEAMVQMEVVTLHRGVGQCDIGINRRRVDPNQGVIRMQPNAEGEVDPEVTVLRFLRSDGSLKGVMFHYACHPTTTSENLVSSEFPGVAMETLEQAYGSGMIASYLQGCCGEIRPALVQDDRFTSGTAVDVERLGSVLVDTVRAVLDQPMETLTTRLVSWGEQRIALPYASVPSTAELEACSGMSGVRGEWSRLMLTEPHRLQTEAVLEVSGWQLADEAGFIGMNGEPVLHYGQVIKQISGGKVLPLGYTNGMLGYIPTASQLAEGGYEAVDSAYYFGLAAPFAPEIESRIVAACQKLLPTSSLSEGGNLYVSNKQIL